MDRPGRMDRGPICPFCTVSLSKSAKSCDVCGSLRCSHCTVMIPPHHSGPCPTCNSPMAQWKCPSCTFLNSKGAAGQAPCDACGLIAGTQQPPARSPKVVAAIPVAVVAAKKDEPPAAAEWPCKVCTCRNVKERSVCVACGEPRATEQRPPQQQVATTAAAHGAAVVSSADGLVDKKLLAEVEAIRAVCRTAKSYFVDLLNPLEMNLYHWESAFGNKLGAGPVESLLPDFLRPKKTLSIFPPEGPKAVDVCQGELGDCWFLCVVAVLAESQPSLVSSLFLLKDVNPEGVFALKMWKDGEWSAVVIDATFPTVFGGTMLKFAHCRKPTDLWVPLLEKAYAKICGGYQNIESGRPIDAFYDLTGMPCLEWRNGCGDGDSRESLWVEETFIPQLASYCSAHCVITACCGGTRDTSDAANNLGLIANHAYSVLAVDVDPRSGSPVITIRNPWGRSQQGRIGRADDRGIARLSFAQFAASFSTVTVCITRNFATSVSIPNIQCSPTTMFSIQNPHQLAFTVCETAEVYVLAAQPDARRMGRKYFDVMLLICLCTSTGYKVVAASKSGCNRVSMVYGMLDPGRYCVLPLSLQASAPLNFTLLSESRHVSFTPETITSKAYPNPVLPVLLLEAGSRAGRVTRYPQGFMDLICISVGTFYALFVVNKDRGTVTASVNTKQSHGMLVVGSTGQPSATSTVVVPPGRTSIVAVASILPTTGAYACSFGWENTAVTGGSSSQIGRGLFAPF